MVLTPYAFFSTDNKGFVEYGDVISFKILKFLKTKFQMYETGKAILIWIP
jgi:hypothetical protein